MNSLIDFIKNIFLRVPISELLLFVKHLSIMMRSGMTVIEGLKIVRRQIKNKRFNEILDKVIVDVENGQFLSEALKQHQAVFGELFVSVIKLGELSGTLSENLDYLSKELRESQQLRSKIKSALIYPIIVMIAAISVTSVLIFFIMPKIMPVFVSLNVKLPTTTKILMGFADAIRHYYYLVIIVFFVLAVIWSLLRRLEAFNYLISRIVLKLPFVGYMVVGYNMANFTRILGLLLKSGVKIVEAIITTSNIVSNPVYKRAYIEASEEIKKGAPLNRCLIKYPLIFPPTVSYMIEVGEKTGKLESNLLYLSEFYGDELDDKVKNISSILEPAVLLIMGVIVGFIVVSIITPIYQVTQGLRR